MFRDQSNADVDVSKGTAASQQVRGADGAKSIFLKTAQAEEIVWAVCTIVSVLLGVVRQKDTNESVYSCRQKTHDFYG